jgi:hypothetical protein
MERLQLGQPGLHQLVLIPTWATQLARELTAGLTDGGRAEGCTYSG